MNVNAHHLGYHLVCLPSDPVGLRPQDECGKAISKYLTRQKPHASNWPLWPEGLNYSNIGIKFYNMEELFGCDFPFVTIFRKQKKNISEVK